MATYAESDLHGLDDKFFYTKHIAKPLKQLTEADTFDAMYSDRPYRKRMNYEKAVGIIKEASGTQFVPDVVDAFVRLAEKGEFRADDDKDGISDENTSNISNH